MQAPLLVSGGGYVHRPGLITWGVGFLVGCCLFSLLQQCIRGNRLPKGVYGRTLGMGWKTVHIDLSLSPILSTRSCLVHSSPLLFINPSGASIYVISYLIGYTSMGHKHWYSKGQTTRMVAWSNQCQPSDP